MQTALLIETPTLEGNPFFKLAPDWAVIPLVILATLATIIASQAIITGAFSHTRQAIQLGWFPGLLIRQTSADAYGQIYVPFLNWAMMIGTLLLTWDFGSSARLAGAYGTAVSTRRVREKLGSLRVCFDVRCELCSGAVEMVRAYSEHVCEVSGKLGSRCAGSGVKTLSAAVAKRLGFVSDNIDARKSPVADMGAVPRRWRVLGYTLADVAERLSPGVKLHLTVAGHQLVATGVDKRSCDVGGAIACAAAISQRLGATTGSGRQRRTLANS